jgi:hypothetical protein
MADTSRNRRRLPDIPGIAPSKAAFELQAGVCLRKFELLTRMGAGKTMCNRQATKHFQKYTTLISSASEEDRPWQ